LVTVSLLDALSLSLSLSLLASVGLGGYFAGSDSHILRPAFVQSESQPNYYTGQGTQNWEQGTGNEFDRFSDNKVATELTSVAHWVLFTVVVASCYCYCYCCVLRF